MNSIPLRKKQIYGTPSTGCSGDFNETNSEMIKRRKSCTKNTESAAEKEMISAALDGDSAKIHQLLLNRVSPECICQTPGQTEGLRPLHLAAWAGHVKIVRLLLDCQVKRHSVAKGMKAVHFAAKGGHVKVLQALWDAECNIKSRTPEGRSALHLAAIHGHMDAVEWLVEKGVYVHIKDFGGHTAGDLGSLAGEDKIASYLQDKMEEMRLDGIKGEKKLGEGAFGVVNLVQKDSKYFVLKKINLKVMERKQQDYAHTEIKLLQSMKHPYIVSCLGGGFKDRYLYIKMEYCSGGDLYTRITQQRLKKEYFEEKQVVSWTLRLTLALKYIHSRNIIHRDVKPNNIFLAGNGIIKLGDFGLAKSLGNTSVASTFLGSSAYMSPELMSQNKYDAGVDMWAFGCVMFEMAALKIAFPFTNLELPINYSKDYERVVKVLLQDDCSRRPTAADLLTLPLYRIALETQLEEKESLANELNQEIDDLCTEMDELLWEDQKRKDILFILTGKGDGITRSKEGEEEEEKEEDEQEDNNYKELISTIVSTEKSTETLVSVDESTSTVVSM